MSLPRPHVLNVRLASPEFLALVSIAETIAQQNRNPFPDRSSAARYAIDLVGRLIDRNLLDHVANLVPPSGGKATQ